MKKNLLLLFVFCCLFFSSLQTRAESVGEVVDGSVLTNDKEVTGSTLSNARGTYLSNGNARLSDKGNHVVNVWGCTSCYKTCDQVKVTLHLQKLVNGTWSTVKTLDTKIAYNDHYVSNSKNITVTGGYYYRIFGSHTAVKGSKSETTSSTTSGMWVSK